MEILDDFHIELEIFDGLLCSRGDCTIASLSFFILTITAVSQKQ